MSALPEYPCEAKAHINRVRSHSCSKSQVLIRAAAAQEAERVEKVIAGTAAKVL